MIHLYYNFYEACPIKQQYKTEHRLGLELLAQGLSDLYHLTFTQDTLADALITSEHGKPMLRDYPHIHFNISHCDLLVLCCFDNTPIGIDAELIRDFRKSIFRRTLSESEKVYFEDCDETLPFYQQRFYCIWTLKESWIKHSGLGLSQTLTDSAFTIEENETGFSVTSNLPQLYFKNLYFADQRYMVSICAEHPIEEICFHD